MRPCISVGSLAELTLLNVWRQVGDMTQPGKELDSLNLDPETHVGEENQILRLSSDLHTYPVTCTYLYIYTQRSLLCLFFKGQLQLLLSTHPILQVAVHIGFSCSMNFNTQTSLLPPMSPLCHLVILLFLGVLGQSEWEHKDHQLLSFLWKTPWRGPSTQHTVVEQDRGIAPILKNWVSLFCL